MNQGIALNTPVLPAWLHSRGAPALGGSLWRFLFFPLCQEPAQPSLIHQPVPLRVGVERERRWHRENSNTHNLARESCWEAEPSGKRSRVGRAGAHQGKGRDGPQLTGHLSDIGSQLPSPSKGSGCDKVVVFQPRDLCCLSL